jgi:hypothetical protein
MRPEKTRRLVESRRAQQNIEYVGYDMGHGFDLPYRQKSVVTAPAIGIDRIDPTPMRMLPDYTLPTTVLMELAKDVSFGIGIT